ncbi:protein SLC31A2 [Eucyclogobius newberryi]|uniref:protein SLC31A2 n=1 Tax=Eucyclogobius newberryi TaxID=166745 RepID=UPI003B5C1587
MSMTFDASSSVTLLFDFWEVHGVAGMLLSVLIVFLLTLTYEVLKVSRVWLNCRFKSTAPPPGDSSPTLEPSLSESSLAPIASMQPPSPLGTQHSLLLHSGQACLHVLQVALGYVLMLCVMSYNTWIFLAVICGSVLGYFLLFPLFTSLTERSAM